MAHPVLTSRLLEVPPELGPGLLAPGQVGRLLVRALPVVLAVDVGIEPPTQVVVPGEGDLAGHDVAIVGDPQLLHLVGHPRGEVAPLARVNLFGREVPRVCCELQDFSVEKKSTLGYGMCMQYLQLAKKEGQTKSIFPALSCSTLPPDCKGGRGPSESLGSSILLPCCSSASRWTWPAPQA